MITVQLHCQPL